MFLGSDAQGLLTTAKDSRVTTVGRVLRRFKVDELPQLFNVLVGDMSLVGPRPEVQKFIDRYPLDARAEILSIRPGVTDNASIYYYDENELLDGTTDPERVYTEEILPRKIALYRTYVRTHSTLVDLKIIALTFARIVEATMLRIRA